MSLHVVMVVVDTPRGQGVGIHASLYSWNEAVEVPEIVYPKVTEDEPAGITPLIYCQTGIVY